MRAEAINLPEALAGQIDVKLYATAQAHSMWFHGFALAGTEDDAGQLVFIATRDAVTLRFNALRDVEAWLEQLDVEAAAPGVHE